jgi:hypothetical protein
MCWINLSCWGRRGAKECKSCCRSRQELPNEYFLFTCKISFDTAEIEPFHFHNFSSLQGFNFHQAVVSSPILWETCSVLKKTAPVWGSEHACTSNEGRQKQYVQFQLWFISSLPFSIFDIALGAMSFSPQLRLLIALYGLSTPRASNFSICTFVRRMSVFVCFCCMFVFPHAFLVRHT